RGAAENPQEIQITRCREQVRKLERITKSRQNSGTRRLRRFSAALQNHVEADCRPRPPTRRICGTSLMIWDAGSGDPTTHCRGRCAATIKQMAKSVYSGFTVSVGGSSMPAATVAFVPCSIRMNEPVRRFVTYPS